MENLSHTFSRKNSYTSNVGFPATNAGVGKSIYDDVFGGAPKFGMTSLAPRLQDYTEIFGGFHSSRGSSIPVLDLPTVDDEDDDIFVDVRSSRFDYSEVFGQLNGIDFALCFEDLVNEANGGYDSSDEAWSPAHSESLSGETDPSACSERSQNFPNADNHQSLDDVTQFNVSYHKAHQRSNENISNGKAHFTHLHAIPGYTCVVDENAVSQKADSEKISYQVSNDLNRSHDFEERVVGKKRFSKSMSLPMDTTFRRHGSYLNPSDKVNKSGPMTKEPFITVSNISLRTKPSQLPPPSRPPPVLAVRKGESGNPRSKFKASKSYAFERVAGDKLSPFFDVKLDEYSCTGFMKDAVEKTRSKLSSTEEVVEGRRESLDSYMELQVEDDMNVMEQNMIKTFDKCNDSVGDRLEETWAKEGTGMETSAEERKRVAMKSKMFADGIEREIDEKPAERKHRTRTSSQGSYKSEEILAWQEGAEFFEVETDNSWMSFEHVKSKNISKRDVESHENPECLDTAAEPFEQKKSCNTIKAAKEGLEWEDNHNQLKVTESSFQHIDGQRRYKTTKGSNSQLDNQKNGQVNESSHALESNRERLHMAQQHGEIGKLFDKEKNVENLEGPNQDSSLQESKQEMKAASARRDDIIDANSRKGNDMRYEEVFQREHSERRNNDTIEQIEFQKKAEEKLEQQKRGKQQEESLETEGKKNIREEAFERKENENGLKEALESKDDKKLKHNIQHAGTQKMGKMGPAQEEYKREHKIALNGEEYKKMLGESCKQEEIEKEFEESLQLDTFEVEHIIIHDWDRNEELVSDASGWENYEMGSKESMEQESNKNRSTESCKEEQTEKQCEEANGQETVGHVSDDAGKPEELTQKTENKEQIERNICIEGGSFPALNEKCEVKNESLCEIHLAVKHDHGEMFPCENSNKIKIEIQGNEEEVEDQLANLQSKEGINSCDKKKQGVLQHTEHKTGTEAVKDLPGVQERVTKPNQVGSVSEKPPARQVISHKNDLENAMTNNPEVHRGVKVGGVQVTVDNEAMREKSTTPQVVREWVDNARKIGDALQAVLEDVGDIADADHTGTNQGTETKEKNMNGTLLGEEPKVGKRLKKDREMEHADFGTKENERARLREREKDLMAKTQRIGERLKEKELDDELLKRIEEEREREREREKDRMAVDGALREARERSYVEARERAERAAVDRANAEVRQRAMAEARERLEKPSAEAREARIRAERAAAERATAEARQRAFGKVMAEKPHVEARNWAERSVDKPRSMDMKQSSSSSDIRFQRTGSLSGLRYTYSSANVGVEGESPQRCKARLERYQRTAERAAKALAEKNMRDLVAQREQEQRNRLAETLDADVRRWSSGKEGNLRALLSTLQYILGPDSGWQPIPLTEVITSAAVKRAYRKATLCVHPDKLQQRGASIQQKYICEKVFDLLKDAWNKFNSEER